MKRHLAIIVILVFLGVLHGFVWRYVVIPPNIRRYADHKVIPFLEQLAKAQIEFKRRCHVDQDGDGVGEYGFLCEIAGQAVPRNPGAKSPVAPEYVTFPWKLKDEKGQLNAGYYGYGIILWIPGPDGPVNDDSLDGTSAKPGATLDPTKNQGTINAQENHFVIYAWPNEIGSTGTGTYFINERGKVFCCGWERRHWSVTLLPAVLVTVAFAGIFVTYVLFLIERAQPRVLRVFICIWFVAFLAWLVNVGNVVVKAYKQPWSTRYEGNNAPSPDAAFRKGEKVFVGKVANHEKGNDDQIWWQLQWWDKVPPSL
ncbi:MAG: hypothetical protein AB1696_04120 [Planctomycetota bacterium]